MSVLLVSPKGKRLGRHMCVGREQKFGKCLGQHVCVGRVAQGQRRGRNVCVRHGFRRWKMAHAAMNTFTLRPPRLPTRPSLRLASCPPPRPAPLHSRARPSRVAQGKFTRRGFRRWVPRVATATLGAGAGGAPPFSILPLHIKNLVPSAMSWVNQ